MREAVIFLHDEIKKSFEEENVKYFLWNFGILVYWSKLYAPILICSSLQRQNTLRILEGKVTFAYCNCSFYYEDPGND